ncbi:MAG: hypothetical protein GBAus27B_000451 [Mycoplasmataceae bacterium]|nr:MAG: hypothetical protein GBAus27B_000451 [Mycoplasmataceae bacterium]
MKLIIWWCFLMAALPFLHLFLVKKKWNFLSRLVIGSTFLVILLIGYLAPSEITRMALTNEIKKERTKPFLKLEENLKNLSSEELKTSDSEKIHDEKLILKQKNETEKIEKRKDKNKEDARKNYLDLKESFAETFQLQKKWIKKWWKDEQAQALLFCGDNFNTKLAREEEIKDFNIIDFGLTENNKVDSLQEKLKKICQQEEDEFMRSIFYKRPSIWLKNIDKADSKIEKKLLEIINFDKNSNLGEYYQEIKVGEKNYKIKKKADLSQFILVVTASSTKPKINNQLLTKLKHIEPFWNKICWWIFSFSLGIEVIVFYLLIKSNRKNKKTQSLPPFEKEN